MALQPSETIDIQLLSVNERLAGDAQIIISHNKSTFIEGDRCEGGNAVHIREVLYTITGNVTRICTCSGCGRNLLFPE